jgi:F-type H+-transporting ATPase subunit a
VARGRAAIAGFLKYWYNFVPHVPGVIGVVLFPLLFALEIIAAIIKPFALAIRLFANMMAGHVVLGSLLVMIPVIRGLADSGIAVAAVLGCAALSCLELLVAFLQAYIFTFLTCIFIGAAVSPEH